MPDLNIRDYLFAGAIVVLLIAFGWYTVHERGVGKAEQIALQAKIDQVTHERDMALLTEATVTVNRVQEDFNHATAAPVTDAPVPVGLCDRPALIELPNATAGNVGGTGQADVRDANAQSAAEAQRLADFANEALTIARDADAAVTAVQNDDHALRQEMAGK